MNNATKHAATLKALPKKLARRFPPDGFYSEEPPAPLDALVLGVLRRDAAESAAAAAFAAAREEFVDFNDLRAATDIELVELFEPFYGPDDAATRGPLVRTLLNNVFEAVGRLTLDRVATLSRREVRPALAKALGEGEETAYVANHVALVSLDFAVLPVDVRTRDMLARHKAIDPDAGVSEASRFCEQNLKVEECRALFASARLSAK